MCNLQVGGDQRLESVDQRVTVDIENFCQNLSELYSSVFKCGCVLRAARARVMWR